MTGIDKLPLADRQGLPDALRVLLEDYPREAWETSPNFSGLIRFWLDRHLMFRRVLAAMESETTDALDKSTDPHQFASRLSRYAGFFVQELHAHHTIEDREYFPRLKTLDARIGWGFDVLDRDHHDIDGHLNGFVEDANAFFQALSSDEKDTAPHLDRVHKRLTRTDHFLDRHLTDEEELVVPILLKYAPSGLL